MIQRCHNERAPNFKNYGARGISVCDRWRNFENFLADIGPRPIGDWSIEREDNEGNYEPANCVWADRHTQNTNQRTRKDNSLGERGISSTGTAYRVNLHHRGVKYVSRSIRSLADAVELRDFALGEIR